jgi:hypothetical protein
MYGMVVITHYADVFVGVFDICFAECPGAEKLVSIHQFIKTKLASKPPRPFLKTQKTLKDPIRQ